MNIRDVGAGSVARTYTRQVTDGVATPGQSVSRREAGRPRTDQVTLSADSQQFLRIQGEVSSQPEIRGDRVAALRASIESGTYRVDTMALAAAMVRV